MVAQDGETHWMEGVLLLGVYLILALAFYHLPERAMGLQQSPASLRASHVPSRTFP